MTVFSSLCPSLEIHNSNRSDNCPMDQAEVSVILYLFVNGVIKDFVSALL